MFFEKQHHFGDESEGPNNHNLSTPLTGGLLRNEISCSTALQPLKEGGATKHPDEVAEVKRASKSPLKVMTEAVASLIKHKGLSATLLEQLPSRGTTGDNTSSPLSSSSAYAILGVEPSCTATQLKAAFRAKVKQYHPDVNRDGQNSDTMIRRVIQAYEMLSEYSRPEIIERECFDPFDDPECEAFDLFVNEVLCVGKGCPYSCVKMAPHAFTYNSSTGTARATCKGHGEDYQVQIAVGQCPRSCIHYVTPSQRIILEELLDSILNVPYDISAEADLLYSLIIKAKFENNRYQKPKRQPKTSSKRVDWY